MTAQLENFKSLFSDLFAKLMAFTLEQEFLQDLGDALEVFYNLQPGEEYEFSPTEEFLFLSWFLLDDADAEGNSLMDEYMRAYADSLSLQETQICAALKGTHLNLLQIKSIQPGVSMHLRDLFSGEEFDVTESISSENITENSILFTRVLKLGETRFLVGAGIFLDPSVQEPITAFITDQYKLECEEGHFMSFNDFLKNSGELINWWVRAYEKGELFQEGEEPEADGDGTNPENPVTKLPVRTPKTPKEPKSPLASS